MKLVTFARIVAFSLLALPLHAAVDTVLVNWNHTWSFMHPMGTLPDRPLGGADTNFDATWFLAQADFATQYDGPTFGITPRQNGVPATLNSYDSGTGPGPFAYDTVNYYTTVGAEFTATGTALTQPATGNRRTAYFRTTFNVGAEARLPVLRYLLDDGGYVYLDGVLVARLNCPATNDTYTVLASNTTTTEDALRTINLSTVGAQANGTVLVAVPQLAAGTHTLAVSVHNAAVGSSDLAMAVQLRGSVGAVLNTPVVSNITRNDNGSPTTPGDDTYTFDVSVTGIGLGPNWTSDATPSSGAYGVPVTMGPFFTAFSPKTVNFFDATDTTGTNRVVVAAPGCSMSATTGAYVYHDNGTPELTDDQFEVDVIVSQRFGSDTWQSGSNPSSGGYNTPVRMGPFSIGVTNVITFQDAQVGGCTTSLSILAPARIGIASIPGAASTNLVAQGLTGTVAPWVANSTQLTLSQSNGGGTNAHVRATIPFPLTGVTGPKRLRFDLNIVDTSTGSNFETEDQLRLEIVTVAGGVTNVIEATDSLDTNNNGYVNGYSTTVAVPYDANRQLDEFNLPLAALAGTINYTLPFQFVFTNNLDSIQLVARGVNNATSEQFNLRNIRLDIATCQISATAAGAVTFSNGGDNNPANDTFSFPVNIGTIYVGSSTGWTSDANPASGLYADAQPVTFGPFSVNAGTRAVTISDATGGGACVAVVSNTPPVAAVAVTVSNIIRLDNGPGTNDDTWQFTATVTGTAVGLNFTNNLTAASGVYGTPLVVGPLAFNGNVNASFGDIARPSARQTVVVTPPAARHVMGVASLGTTYNFGAALGEAQSTIWVNNAAQRTLTLANGGGADQAVRSEWLSLTGLQGPVQFSAEVIARDTSTGSGFEANDTLLARLLYVVGGVTNTVNLTGNYDRDGSGRMNGYTGVTNATAATTAIDYSNNAARDEFNFGSVPAAALFTNNVALSWLIPDAATAARFEILGANNSTTEAFILQNAAFTFLADSEPDGLPDAWETANFGSTLFDSGSDVDSDGASNLEEYLAGTHPAQTFSSLHVANPAVNGAAYSVTWDTVAGKFYQLQFTPDALPSTTWTNLGSVQRATGTTLTLSGTLPTPGRGYLRVMLVP